MTTQQAAQFDRGLLLLAELSRQRMELETKLKHTGFKEFPMIWSQEAMACQAVHQQVERLALELQVMMHRRTYAH